MAASSSSQAGAAATTITTPAPLKSITNNFDSCTFIKAKAINSPYGCHTYRSCQSCLEMSGCVVNDLGICVSSKEGIFNLDRGDNEYSFGYNESIDFTQAISKNLALPAALTSNAASLSSEQNWHFRAGEATYCSASDATCQECKQKNFWRANSTSVLPDSRFCVGQNGCVCVQNCEVPTLKPQGCQWLLSSPSPSGYGYGYGGYSSGSSSYTYATDRLGWWNWLLIVGLVIVIHFFSKCWSSERTREMNLVKTEARRAARGEMGLMEEEQPLQVVHLAASLPSPRVETATASTAANDANDPNDATKIETPRTETDSSEAVFVEVVDARTARAAASSS